MDIESTRKWVVIFTALNVSYHVLVWTTAILGVAYLFRLALFRELLEPIPTNGTDVNLDLLQTSALLVAATALIGTVTATGINRLSALVIPSDRSDIQVSEIVQQKGRSLLRRLNSLGIWIWCPVQVALATLTLHQCTVEATLTDSSRSTTALIVDGWLALACAGSWSFLAFVASSLIVTFYTELRHDMALRNLRVKRQRENSQS